MSKQLLFFLLAVTCSCAGLPLSLNDGKASPRAQAPTGVPYKTSGSFGMVLKRMTGSLSLFLYEDGTFSEVYTGCFGGSSSSGRAYLDDDRVYLQREDGYLVLYYLREFGGRRVLLLPDFVAGFDLFPSFDEGFFELFSTDTYLPTRNDLAVQRGYNAPPRDLDIVRARVRRDKRQRVIIDFMPTFQWLKFVTLWTEIQRPPQCKAAKHANQTMIFRWEGGEKTVKYSKRASLEELAGDCDPWLRLVAWVQQNQKRGRPFDY